MIVVDKSYGCTDFFFRSSKKPGLELKSELEFDKILANFSELLKLQLSHLPAESMVEVCSISLTETSS